MLEKGLNSLPQVPNYSNMKVVVVHHHTFDWGPVNVLFEFLITRARRVLLISHPFDRMKYHGSNLTMFQNQVQVKEIRLPSIRSRESVLLIKDIIATMFYLIRMRTRWDVYIGVDCLNCSVGLALKKLGFVRRVVFYAIDYTPQRFENPIKNAVFHRVERYSLLSSDRVWNMSKRMTKVWEGFGVKKGKNFLAPNCLADFELRHAPFNGIRSQSIVFVGHLHPSKGIQMVIEAFPEIQKHVRDANLVIIGSGPLDDSLRDSCRRNEIEEAVHFVGHVSDRRRLLRIISECKIGVAPYLPGDLVAMNLFGDPGKVKLYLACGLPIIMTSGPELASEVDKHQAGIIIDYDKKAFVGAAVKLLTNEEFFVKCQKNAESLASSYSCEKIFAEAFRHLFGFPLSENL